MADELQGLKFLPPDFKPGGADPLSGIKFLPDGPLKKPPASATPEGPTLRKGNTLDPTIDLTTAPLPTQQEDDLPHRGFWEAVVNPITSYPDMYHAVRERGIEEMSEGLEGAFKGETMFQKALGALELLGGMQRYAMAPLEAGARTVVGRPFGELFEKATGIKGSAKWIEGSVGLTTSLTAGLKLDPIMLAAKGVRAAKESKVGEGILKVINPATIETEMASGQKLPLAQWTSQMLRSAGGGLRWATWRANMQLERFSKVVRKLRDDERYAFIDAMETPGGVANIAPELQPMANKIRELLDAAKERVQSLGIGALDQARENYFPHIWKNPDPLIERTLEAERTAGASKGPLHGSKAFLKKRTFETTKEGMDAGYVPITSDPLQLAFLKLREMDKFYWGNRFSLQFKNSGIPKFVPWNKSAPFGYRELDDPAFQARLGPHSQTIPGQKGVASVAHETALDADLQTGLERVGRELGVTIKAPLRSEDPYLVTNPGTRGYTMRRPPPGKMSPEVVSTFGNSQTVLEHELGHQVDWSTGMSSRIFSESPDAWAELADLALYRVDESTRLSYRTQPTWQQKVAGYGQYTNYPYDEYLLAPEERIANLIHAYWHAPQLLEDVAPNASRWLSEFLNKTPAQLGIPAGSAAETSWPRLMAAIRDVKPGLRHDSKVIPETVTFNTDPVNIFVPGWRDMGKWYAPEAASRIFNNYMSSGLAGQNGFYDMLRHSANSLNMFQLGFSAFHATFTTIDTMISRMALGLEQTMRGEFGRGAKNMALGTLPTTAYQTAKKGDVLLKAAMDPKGLEPATQKLFREFPLLPKIIRAAEMAGGAPKMDVFWKAAEDGGLIRGMRDGTLIKGIKDQFAEHPFRTVLQQPFKIAAKTAQDSSHWLMEYLVPRQKLGVFSDLAADWLRRNPGANDFEMIEAMQKMWNSVDNRLGQFVYDNTFWHKMFKDVSFISMRSVGWNLGTVQELGGATFDAARAVYDLRNGDLPEFTHKMAYAITMPIVTSMYGGMLYYLYNGKPPETIRDYFFPRTGRLTPKGDEERVTVPSYIKDVLEYNQSPVATAVNKLNPLWSFGYQLYKNEDFYGGLIRDPQAEPVAQALQFGDYLWKQFEPFSWRGIERLQKEGADWKQQAGSLFGFQPAPFFITAPERSAAFQRRQEIRALRRRAREP